MNKELIALADNYADCRGAEDCGGDPKHTENARAVLVAAIEALEAELLIARDWLKAADESNEQLQAQLAAAQGQEPVGICAVDKFKGVSVGWYPSADIKHNDKLYAAPIPQPAQQAQPERVECCEQCDDGDGLCVFPMYGPAPHTHDTSNGWIGSTRTLPKDQWGNNFREDPDCEGHGVYMRCEKCGRGEQPAQQAQPQLRAADHWFAEWELVIPEDARKAFKETVQEAQAEPTLQWCDKCGEGTVQGLCRGKLDDCKFKQAQPERAPSDAISAHLLDSREKNIRCVKPLSCPKCHALWLFWPSEQSGFATDTLSVKSATHCDYCENARADQLSTLDRVQPQATPLPDHEIVTMYAECPRSDAEMIEFARAIEAAHGIKQGGQQ